MRRWIDKSNDKQSSRRIDQSLLLLLPAVGNNNLLKKNLSQWLRVTQPPAATSHQ